MTTVPLDRYLAAYAMVTDHFTHRRLDDITKREALKALANTGAARLQRTNLLLAECRELCGSGLSPAWKSPKPAPDSGHGLRGLIRSISAIHIKTTKKGAHLSC